jgi:hypothetical protein
MNEQTQKLAEQAREFANGWFAQDVYRTREDMFNAKFSELLIKECEQVAKTHAARLTGVASWSVDLAMQEVKKHFGVE